MAHFTSQELSTLWHMRARFLEGTGGAGDYWRTEGDLALYDATFGARIAWKWQAVLGELATRGWRPQSTRLLDWGCGAGIASRSVLAQWPEQFGEVRLHDRSARAMRFAAARIPSAQPAPTLTAEDLSNTLLLVSHVMNELSDAQLAGLRELALGAREVLWVEAGTHAESRRLGAEVREPLLAGGFRAVGPCTHSQRCGMLMPRNERHWCHSFARPPSEVFQDARWALMAKELRIDLRSLPYCFLALQRESGGSDSGAARVIGHPREYKGFLKVLGCEADGVRELSLQRRDDPALWRQITTGDQLPLYLWTRQQGKILCGRATEGEAAERTV